MRSSGRLNYVPTEGETDQNRLFDPQMVKDPNNPLNAAIDGELLVDELPVSRQVDRDAVVVVAEMVDDRPPHVSIDHTTVKQDDRGRPLRALSGDSFHSPGPKVGVSVRKTDAVNP